jgi:N-acetylmuramoyl-L-alanine amidase
MQARTPALISSFDKAFSGPDRHRLRGLFGLAMLLGLTAARPLAAAEISAFDMGDDQIVLRFNGPVSHASTFLLDGPNRIALDVDGVRARRGGNAGGPVTNVRQGQRAADTTRVVFDLAAPVIITDGKLSEDGRSLTLSIAPASQAVFGKNVRRGRVDYGTASFNKGAPGKSARNNVTITLDPPQPLFSGKLPRIMGGGRDSGRPLVVIDPGHGGHDPGAISVFGDRKEKDAALGIAKALREELLASGRVRVAMTREDDRFLVLQQRREIARRLKADLFISIHADSAPSAGARGASAYTLSDVASDQVAARLAAKENRADVLNGVNLGGENNDVSSILIDLTQRETMNISSSFATLLEREMSNDVSVRDGYHRFANFAVLKAPDVPSVLIETGYTTNIDDAKRLFSKEGQQKTAVSIRRAIEAHFARKMASN